MSQVTSIAGTHEGRMQGTMRGYHRGFQPSREDTVPNTPAECLNGG